MVSNYSNLSHDSKSTKLARMAERLEGLKKSPLYQYRQENNYHPVIGEGNPEATIMFIGEAPGAKEAETGRPFVGRAGKFLDSLLRSINLDRSDVYITNIVKDRPPNNRQPNTSEIKFYTPFLIEQLEIIKPRIVATLGRLAMKFIFNTYELPQKNRKIGELHGKVFQSQAPFGELVIIPLYHPAAVFYNRALEQNMKEDFEKLRNLIENLPTEVERR